MIGLRKQGERHSVRCHAGLWVRGVGVRARNVYLAVERREEGVKELVIWEV